MLSQSSLCCRTTVVPQVGYVMINLVGQLEWDPSLGVRKEAERSMPLFQLPDRRCRVTCCLIILLPYHFLISIYIKIK